MMLEPQEHEYYCCEKKNKNRKCFSIILGIITAALTFSIGLLVGALNAEVLLAAISAIEVLIAILALLLIINIILIICRNIR